RPHRHQITKEVYLRREDECARITMREIHELTLQAVSEATRVESSVDERRKAFRIKSHDWLMETHGGSPGWGCGEQFVGVPAPQLDLGRVVGRPNLLKVETQTVAHLNGRDLPCTWPWYHALDWKPGLRSVVAEATTHNGTRFGASSLQTNGIC